MLDYKVKYKFEEALLSIGVCVMATIKDVAKRAGVAPSTVSYALSGKRPISDEVKKRIAMAVEELNFKPNSLANNLRIGSSRTIGIAHPLSEISPDSSGLDIIAAASEGLRASHTLSLITHQEAPEKLIARLRQRSIDGLILMHIARQDERVEALRQTNYPFVLIGRPEKPVHLSLVDFDFEKASFLAVQHLVQLGHKTIGYLDLPDKERSDVLGYAYYMTRGLQAAQEGFTVDLYGREAGRSNQHSYDATLKLLESKPELTAIIVLLGSTYMGVLRALHERGKKVPEDCSIICLGSTPGAIWSNPSLTTIDNQLLKLGNIAADLILEKIAGNTTNKQILLPAELTIRESTGQARNA